MNKKFLLLSAAFAMVSATAVDAKVTGFYAGVSGTGNFAQFKVYDASRHEEGKAPLTIPGEEYARIDEPTINSGVNAQVINYKIETGDQSSVTMVAKSILEGDKNNIAEDTIYKVRPSAKIFVGYNYQIGSNFVVGVELAGGMAFGAHKYSGVVDIPELKNWGTSSNNLSVKEKDPVKDKTVRTDFEIKTKFDGDFSVRLGYLIPSTDGRLALFLRGGVGLINRELKVHQNSVDTYLLAAVDAAGADVKSGISQRHHARTEPANSTIKKSNPASGVNFPNWEAALQIVPLSFLRYYTNLMKGFTGYLKGNDAAAKLAGDMNVIINKVQGCADAKAALDAVCLPITELILANAKTNKDLYYKDKIEAPSMNKSETKFTWHVGADAEYHFASGLFVRASYTFKYAKGFFAEASTALKGLNKADARAVIDESFESGNGKYSQFGKFIINATSKNDLFVASSLAQDAQSVQRILGRAQSNLNDDTLAIKREMIDVVKRELIERIERMPDLSLGTLNSKLGLGKKSFYHEFSLGFGYKFF